MSFKTWTARAIVAASVLVSAVPVVAQPTWQIETALIAGVAAASLGQCNPEINNNWTGVAPPNWNDPINWLAPEGVPDECHNVFIDIAGSDINMNVTSGFGAAYSILSFTPGVIADLQMGAAFGGASTRLNVVEDMISGTVQNQYVIHVGDGDLVASGSPFQGWSSFDSVVNGFRWDINGGRVGVAGTIGPGVWVATDAAIRAGYVLGLGEFDPYEEIIGVAGTIDSGIVTGAAIPAPSTWTLQDVSLRAKRCQNLDVWTVLQSGTTSRVFEIHEYFQVNDMYYEGTGAGNTIKVGYDPQGLLSGLEILNALDLRSPSDNLDGPLVEVERLVVNNNAVLTIQDGTQFFVDNWESPSALAPVLADFRDGSSLRYGERDPNQGQNLNIFWVDERDIPFSRNPPLQFKGESIITSVDDPDLAECAEPGDPEVACNEMQLKLDVHLNVEGLLSDPPARAWYTGDVDLRMESAVDIETAADIEVFAADVCNVWFTDVPEPRCLKYWRSFFSKEGKAYVRLVDNHDNHQPNNDNGPHSLYPEAMYVEWDVTIVGEAVPNIDLNGLNFYYGGEVTILGGGPSPFENGNATRLIKTWYGDFNGDCSVTQADDYPILLEHVTGPGTPSDYPLGDYNGDCDIDLGDKWAFIQNLGRPSHPCCNPNPGGEDCCGVPCPSLTCPTWLQGAGQSGGSSHHNGPLEPLATAQEFVEYLSLEPLSDEEAEEDFMASTQEITDWLVVNLTMDERSDLADELERPDLTFETDLAAELVPTIVGYLRGE